MGKKPLALVPPVDFPEDIGHVWLSFLELSSCKRSDDPLTYTDIKNYLEVTGEYLNPREVKIVMDLYAIYMRMTNG